MLAWRSRPFCGALFITLVCAQTDGVVQGTVPALMSAERASPTPISVAPSQNWDGPNGPWSSFNIRVGTPEQAVRVLVSTASQQTWVVLPNGCLATDAICRDARGGVYNYNRSSTWTQLGTGYYALPVGQNFNISENGFYGRDAIGLGGRGGPTLDDQIVGGIATEKHYLGMFGVNSQSTDFNLNGEQPSYITSLKNQNIIPSLSFGYTAGAQYQLTKVLGSLTLGGYDESRFTRNGITFLIAPDRSRELRVSLRSITSTSRNGTVSSLLPSEILVHVDSTVAEIWLPTDACQAFEEAFNLTYDEESNFYPVDDTLHDALVARDASITFSLGNSDADGETVNITLPYGSFDLQATPPFATKRTRYFPLRRAVDDTQYTLGRTFLQEAYLIVDWERGNFSLSQCLFVNDLPQKLVSIASASKSSDGSDTSESSSSSNGPKIGIGVGVALGVAFLAGILLFFLYRRRKQQKKTGVSQSPEDNSAGVSGSEHEKAELNTDNDHAIHEKGDSDNDPRRRRPPISSSTPSWVRNDDVPSGRKSVLGELSADQVTRGLSPSEPLLGEAHELHEAPGAPATPFELSADAPSELHGSSPEMRTENSATSPPSPLPLSRPSSSAPSSPTYEHLGTRGGTRSSTHGTLLTPSPPSHLMVPSSNDEHQMLSSVSLIGDQESRRGPSSLLSFLRGNRRSGHSSRDT